MPEAGHQLLGTRTGRRRQCVAGVAKVVQAQVWVDIDSTNRSGPGPVEGCPPHRLALRPAEDKPLVSRRGPRGEVRLHVRDYGLREGDGSPAGIALRLTYEERAIL